MTLSASPFWALSPVSSGTEQASEFCISKKQLQLGPALLTSSRILCVFADFSLLALILPASYFSSGIH